MLRVEKLKSSRSHCFVKARFKCLLSDNSRLRLSIVAALLGQLPGFLLSYFTWLTLLWYIHKFIHNNSNLIDYFKNVFPDSSDTTWNQPAVNLFSAPRVERKNEKAYKERIVYIEKNSQIFCKVVQLQLK